MFRHAGAGVPIAAVVLERHGEEIMRVGLVVVGRGNLEGVLEDVQRKRVPVVAVAIVRLGPGRLGGTPHDAEIAVPRLIARALAGPPIERLRVVLPRAAPVALVARRPVRVPERLLGLDPPAVLLLLALHIAHEDVQLLPRLIELGLVRPLRAGLRTPQRVRAPELHPALLGRREVRDIDCAINLVRLEKGFLREELLRLGLLRGVGCGRFSGEERGGKGKESDSGEQRFHGGRLDGASRKTLLK